MEQQLAATLADYFPGTAVEIVDFGAIPGGFSRETYRFDANLTDDAGTSSLPFILRKDPPGAAAILETSRQVEHELIESVRANTSVPVSRSYGAVMDPDVFGEAAMVIERVSGNGQTSDLFNEGPDVDQADSVIAHLCELLAELHTADIATIDPQGSLRDPRGVGIDPDSWDSYMDTTFEYYVGSHADTSYDPLMFAVLDAYLTLRRNKPRELQLSLVHGDFNPANFLYADGKVTALIDWENSRIGDPREDLGWMMMMDLLSNTSVMTHPRDKGGFLAYYNELTGFGVTPEELGYFTLFGTANIAVPVTSAVAARVRGEHEELLHLYLLQPSAASLTGMGQLMGYPGLGA